MAPASLFALLCCLVMTGGWGRRVQVGTLVGGMLTGLHMAGTSSVFIPDWFMDVSQRLQHCVVACRLSQPLVNCWPKPARQMNLCPKAIPQLGAG